jgi:hypothetical protein
MTLRELLKSLHAVDEKNLDMEVMVSPASGGYEGVSHVSVLYVGHPVVHLAEPKPAELPPDLWESQGNVPVVNPDDLKKVSQLFSDFQARNSGQCGSIGDSVYKTVCSPGANVVSVWYRASMLWMSKQMQPELLAQWTHDGQFDDAVFDVAATFPMEKMRTGVVRQGPPVDVEEFVKQIGGRK